MTFPDVAVVILNYNGEKLLPKFLPSVIEHTPHAQIIVADNASTDNSVQWLSENHPSLQVICLQQNWGFAEGYNQALAQVEANYIVLLNSDVEVTANWLEPMIKLLEEDASIAAVQPKIRMYAEKTLFEHAGAAGGMIDYLGYPFCRGRIFDTLEEDKGQYDQTTPIFWASGAAMCIRSEVYHQLGGLDRDFFAHMEEIDLCWRIHHSGQRIVFCPESTVFHVGGGTLNPMSERKIYLNFRNGLVLLVKNLPAQHILFKIFIRLCLDGIAGVKYFLEGKFRFTWAIIKAHFYLYTHLKTILAKRKANTQRFGKLRLPALVYPKSIVYQYFINNKKYFTDLD